MSFSDIDYRILARYILDYDPGIPFLLMVGVFFLVGVSVLWISFTEKGKRAKICQCSLAMFAGYLFLVLYTTIFRRETLGHTECQLSPLWSYHVLNYTILSQNVLNVILFIPLGFFGVLLFDKWQGMKTVGLGCGISMMIELTQLLTRRGVCNIDDVIHNTAGCIIGSGLLLAMQGMYLRIKKQF